MRCADLNSCSHLQGEPNYRTHDILPVIAALNLILAAHPNRTQEGGGVMVGSQFLFPRIRAALKQSLAGYVALPEVEDMDTFLVPASLGDRAGPLGAVVLGMQALD